MNPPEGREIKPWMRKAFESSQKGATVVCLVPARIDTMWWYNYAEAVYASQCDDVQDRRTHALPQTVSP